MYNKWGLRLVRTTTGWDIATESYRWCKKAANSAVLLAAAGNTETYEVFLMSVLWHSSSIFAPLFGISMTSYLNVLGDIMHRDWESSTSTFVLITLSHDARVYFKGNLLCSFPARYFASSTLGRLSSVGSFSKTVISSFWLSQGHQTEHFNQFSCLNSWSTAHIFLKLYSCKDSLKHVFTLQVYFCHLWAQIQVTWSLPCRKRILFRDIWSSGITAALLLMCSCLAPVDTVLVWKSFGLIRPIYFFLFSYLVFFYLYIKGD